MTGKPDWQYYAERLAQTLSRVTEIFGWDQSRLLEATRQQNLSGLGLPSPRVPTEPGPTVGLQSSAADALAASSRKKRQSQLGEF